MRNIKKELETRHEQEIEFTKNKIQSKLKLEKDKIDDMNAQLIEESADID